MADKKIKKYDESSILKMSDLDHIRKRSSLYINSIDDLFMEIFLNALDEASNGFGDTIDIKYHKNGAWSVLDKGRGIPVRRLDDIFLSLNTSGKFNEDSYSYSVGKNGQGCCILTALCEYVHVKVKKDSEVWEAKYTNGGKKNTPAKKTGKCKSTESGSYIEFKTDDEFWKDVKINKELVKQHCAEVAYVMKNITINFEDETTSEKITYKAKDGIINYITDKYEPKKLVVDNIYFTKQKLANGEEVEIVFNWTTTDKTDALYFTNMLKMVELGTGYEGFVQGCYESLQNYANINKDEKTKDTKFDKEDILEGLVVCINSFVSDRILKFAGQTKVKVLTPELIQDVRNYVIQNFQPWLNKNKDQAKKILKVIYATRDSRKAAERAKVSTKAARAAKKLKISDKYSKPQVYDQNRAELVAIEGLSAKGGVDKARTEYQGTFALRGKILNCNQSSLKEILNNIEIQSIIAILDCGIGKSFDIRKCAFRKIIILADQDVLNPFGVQ